MRHVFDPIRDRTLSAIIRHIRERNMTIDARNDGEGNQPTSGDMQEYTVILSDALTGELIEMWVTAAAADIAPSQAVREYLNEGVKPELHDEYLRRGYVTALFCYLGHLEDLGVPGLAA